MLWSILAGVLFILIGIFIFLKPELIWNFASPFRSHNDFTSNNC